MPRPYVNVNDILTLQRVYAGMKRRRPQSTDYPTFRKQPSSEIEFSSAERTAYSPNEHWNERISVWPGDICTLKVDAIVNAANDNLRGGGGVCGAIFRAAGSSLLQKDCDNIPRTQYKGRWVRCPPGSARITSAHKMQPEVKHIIHAVGPVGEFADILRSTYQESLDLAHKNNIKTIAFPSISTGIYGYNIKKATPVALKAVRDWLDKNPDKGQNFSRIIFVVFADLDYQVYMRHVHTYFPRVPDVENLEGLNGGDKATDNHDNDTDGGQTDKQSKEKSPSHKKAKGSEPDVKEEGPSTTDPKGETKDDSLPDSKVSKKDEDAIETATLSEVKAASSSSSQALSSTKDSTLGKTSQLASVEKKRDTDQKDTDDGGFVLVE